MYYILYLSKKNTSKRQIILGPGWFFFLVFGCCWLLTMLLVWPNQLLNGQRQQLKKNTYQTLDNPGGPWLFDFFFGCCCLLSVGQWIGHANNIVNNNQKNTQTLNNPGPRYDFFLVVVGCWLVWLLVVGLIIINNNIINNNQKRAYIILAWVISLKVQVGCVQSHTHTHILDGWERRKKKREREGWDGMGTNKMNKQTNKQNVNGVCLSLSLPVLFCFVLFVCSLSLSLSLLGIYIGGTTQRGVYVFVCYYYYYRDHRWYIYITALCPLPIYI